MAQLDNSNPIYFFKVFKKWLVAKFSQLWDIMLYLVGGEFQKKPGSMKNFERRSNLLDIAFLTSGVGILQKLLSVRVLMLLDILVGKKIYDCNELEAMSSSSKQVLTSSDVLKLNRPMLKWPRTAIALALLDSLEELTRKVFR